MERLNTPPRSNFRHFFVRGLAIVLPSVLTIWILLAAYNFVSVRIAQPINTGIRELVVRFSDWPVALEEDLLAIESNPATLSEADRKAYAAAGHSRTWVREYVQRRELLERWQAYSFPLDLIGLIVAIAIIYLVGGLLGSFIGRRLYKRGEELLSRIPLIRNVYPSVKQVTDFLVGGDDDSKVRFSKVVAVEYPRKGIWSVGLVTGETMRSIQDKAARRCMTVFVPSSPTPFTGYVITVPVEDTIDLPVNIEDALRFTISGGVVIPENQLIAEPPLVADDTAMARN